MGLNNPERQARWRTKRKEEIERLRNIVAEQSKQLAEARREIEIAALQQENAELKIALADERKQHAATKAMAAKPAPPPIDPDEVACLRETNRNLRFALQEMNKWYEGESRRKGIMTFATYGKLMKCLHPDSHPSDAERSEACALLGQWKRDGDRARRRTH